MKKTSKAGVRAPDQTVLSVPMPKKMKAELIKLAAQDSRKTADFVRLALMEVVAASKKQVTEDDSGAVSMPQQPSQSSHGRMSASG